MSLRTYYSELAFAQISLRDEIMDTLEISKRTFYERIKDSSWTGPERKLLSQYFHQPIEVLFPENDMINV
ncbi:MAG: hypothetical protein KAR19_03580 [Bacteroidales bacterium]|nr:hypothetical protein [Bacteroidales bacterium]